MWCQDEAGPYQAIPQPGPSWQPARHPASQPHEYIRDGTAKLLTLFRPATGEVRAAPVRSAPNAVLHPWLIGELEAILAGCPPPASVPGTHWLDWQREGQDFPLPPEALPPLRMLLVWDNLAGHHTRSMVQWCLEHGIVPLYTPIAGSWLNLAESVQRIIVRRALVGQHPETTAQVMAWLAEAVCGWNADPTPFVWGGTRAARRARARDRRYALGGSGGYTHRPIRRRCSGAPSRRNGHVHSM